MSQDASHPPSGTDPAGMRNAPREDELIPNDEPVPVPGSNSASRHVGRYQFGIPDESHRLPVRDRVLDRQVMGQMVPLAEADDLEREARFIARLDHAGAPGVLDFVRNDTGAVLITRKVDGITLTEAIARTNAGNPPHELLRPASVVRMMIRVCETLAAAHARSVVHRQIGPDSILLGWQGQVVVMDWGKAMSEHARPLTIRYVASTTASAVTDLDGLHLDLRGVGLCLFSALTLRAPMPAGHDPLGPLSAEDRRRMPPRLAAIVRQSMVSDAAHGYETMAALQQDLESYLEGHEPAAYIPGRWTRSLRWTRNHLAVSLGVAIILMWATAHYLPLLHDSLAWAAPVIEEDFSDPAWKSRWLDPSYTGSFQVQKGRLVSTGPRGADLIYRQRLATPLAIEYTGEILDGAIPCDLSVSYREGSLDDVTQAAPESGRCFYMQFGGFSNTGFFIRNMNLPLPVAYDKQTLATGRTYRFRVEIEGCRITMLMDGRTVLQYEDLCPFDSGRIGLNAHFPGKAFDDVRIFHKTPAASNSPLSPGDSLMSKGEFKHAESLYALVYETYGEREFGQQAQYRKGLAEWRMGLREPALASWSRVHDPVLAEQIAGHTIQSKTAQEQDLFCNRFADKYRHQTEQRPELLRIWNEAMQRFALDMTTDAKLIDRFLQLRQDLFPTDTMATYLASNVLLLHHRFAEVLRQFPDNRIACNWSLLGLGKSQNVLDDVTANSDVRAKAWQMQGQYDTLIADHDTSADLRIIALCMSGRAAELLDDPSCRYPALLHLGRAQELVNAPNLSPQAANEILICIGRLADAGGAGLPGVPGSGNAPIAHVLLGDLAAAARCGLKMPAFRYMSAVETGEDAALPELRRQVTMPTAFSGHGGWFTAAIVGPMVDRLRGDAQALEQQVRPQLDVYKANYGKRPWFIARAMLGDIPPAEVLNLPAKAEAPAWQAVTLGICEELAGRPAAAIEAYTAFTEMPLYRRLLMVHSPDPEVEWFVGWRLRTLKR